MLFKVFLLQTIGQGYLLVLSIQSSKVQQQFCKQKSYIFIQHPNKRILNSAFDEFIFSIALNILQWNLK